MKKIIAVAAAFALAACGGNAEEAETADAPEEVDVDLPEIGTMSAAGTYTEMDTVSEATIVDMNGDGTYTVMAGGAQTESGAWEQNDEGVCMTPEGGDELCFTMSEGEEEGVRTITQPDGTATRYSYEAE